MRRFFLFNTFLLLFSHSAELPAGKDFEPVYPSIKLKGHPFGIPDIQTHHHADHNLIYCSFHLLWNFLQSH